MSASLRGRLKSTGSTSSDQVVVGDMVGLASTGNAWIIESITPRRSLLARRGRGGIRGKPIAANVDTGLSVVSVGQPEATLELADRLLVLTEACRMRPVLVMNKIDLPGGTRIANDFLELYADAGSKVLKVSALTGDGIDELAQEMAGTVSTMMGPSGVGKSSLLNALDPNLRRRTNPVSRTGRGRHTTVRSRLIRLPGGGLVADTPGFANIQSWGVTADEVALCFPEFRKVRASCQFRNCSHAKELRCAVRQAVNDGAIALSRYGSYLTLRAEVLADGSRGVTRSAPQASVDTATGHP